MKVDLLCIGSELLTGLVADTNGFYLSGRLWSSGIQVRELRVIPDDMDAIITALRHSLPHCDAIICTGGLGPTDDDLTREAVARLLDLPLLLDPEWLEQIERLFARYGYPMPLSNRKQAMAIKGSRRLDNPKGTAPGAIVPAGRRWIILLPGPPQEMQPMFEASVLPFLNSAAPVGASWFIRTLKCAGLGESLLAEKIKQAGAFSHPLSLTARGMEVYLQLKAYGAPATAVNELDEAETRLRRTIGDYIYGVDQETLAGAVVSRLKERQLTLALAESCTGGLLSDLITDIHGSSHILKGSLVAYSPGAKIDPLGVEQNLLEAEGAVSEAVAVAMALKSRVLFTADAGVGITGIAGPESDGSGRPVGLVFVAVAFGEGVNCKQLNLTGTRRAVKERAAQTALAMLWRMMPDDDKA
jgi:nicotinamide-nucleotide amidase